MTKSGNYKAAKLYILVGTFSLLLLTTLFKPAQLDSANLTNVKDTLQSSRLSVAARVDSSGTTAGASRVKIQTSSSAPYFTTSTANLHAGDSVTIGTGTYTIVDIIDADEFTVTPVLAAGDADNLDPIFYKAKPQHVITLTTVSSLPDGFFRILLPADTVGHSDGNPDDGGFDFGTGSIDVTASGGSFDFTGAVATASGGAGCTSPANYHCFEIHYTDDAPAIGQTITIKIGNTNGTNTPVAPAPANTTEATAETYSFYARNYSQDAVSFDETQGRIALIETVRVTATVDPTIDFSIAGVSTGTTTCGATPDIDTTTGVNAPLAVPFGGLTLNSFKDASHNLTVSTNAQSGYVVTASENDELGLGGATSPNIPDTPCDSGPCTESSAQDWVTATNNGFGFSLDDSDDNDTTEAFAYNSGGSWMARQFANIADAETPQIIFSGTTVANAQDVFVCYRISVGATQQAGDYENIITYTATGTF